VDAHELEPIPLFAGLSKHERERVASFADVLDVPPGMHLLDQGAFPYEFLVLLDGEVDVLRDGVRVAGLGVGDFFGEIALLEHERRTASCIAATKCRVAVMTSSAFGDMQRQMPAVAERIRAACAERMAR
jgi:CRP-like cAMP-binding protein